MDNLKNKWTWNVLFCITIVMCITSSGFIHLKIQTIRLHLRRMLLAAVALSSVLTSQASCSKATLFHWSRIANNWCSPATVWQEVTPGDASSDKKRWSYKRSPEIPYACERQQCKRLIICCNTCMNCHKEKGMPESPRSNASANELVDSIDAAKSAA